MPPPTTHCGCLGGCLCVHQAPGTCLQQAGRGGQGQEQWKARQKEVRVSHPLGPDSPDPTLHRESAPAGDKTWALSQVHAETRECTGSPQQLFARHMAPSLPFSAKMHGLHRGLRGQGSAGRHCHCPAAGSKAALGPSTPQVLPAPQ